MIFGFHNYDIFKSGFELFTQVCGCIDALNQLVIIVNRLHHSFKLLFLFLHLLSSNFLFQDFFSLLFYHLQFFLVPRIECFACDIAIFVVLWHKFDSLIFVVFLDYEVLILLALFLNLVGKFRDIWRTDISLIGVRSIKEGTRLDGGSDAHSVTRSLYFYFVVEVGFSRWQIVLIREFDEVWFFKWGPSEARYVWHVPDSADRWFWFYIQEFITRVHDARWILGLAFLLNRFLSGVTEFGKIEALPRFDELLRWCSQTSSNHLFDRSLFR